MRHLGLKKRYMEVLLFFRWGIASLLYPRKLIQPLVILFYPVIFETIQELLNHKKISFFSSLLVSLPPHPHSLANFLIKYSLRNPEDLESQPGRMPPWTLIPFTLHTMQRQSSSCNQCNLLLFWRDV